MARFAPGTLVLARTGEHGATQDYDIPAVVLSFHERFESYVLRATTSVPEAEVAQGLIFEHCADYVRPAEG